jgi:hypothetical protein
MTPRELREILRKVRPRDAALVAGCPPISLWRWSRRQRDVPPHVAERLAPLRDFRPMTSRELHAIVARAGGISAVSRAIDVNHASLRNWMAGRLGPAGRMGPTMAATQKLRELWVNLPKQRRITMRPVQGEAPMSADEIGRIVHLFGGLRRTADLLGCSIAALHSYCNGHHAVAPVVAALLRDAAERRIESDQQITSALRERASTLLMRRERERDAAGHPLHRNQQEVAACVDQIVAVVQASAEPISPADLRQRLGATRRSLARPLACALRSGRLIREGSTWGVRYRAATTAVDTPVATTGSAVWRQSDPPGHKRTCEDVHAEAFRLVALLGQRGPLTVAAIRTALGIPDGQARGTLLHAERAGLVTRRVHDGRLVFALAAAAPQ